MGRLAGKIAFISGTGAGTDRAAALVFAAERAAERATVFGCDVASVAAVRGAFFMPKVPHGAAKGGVPAMSRHLCAAGAPHRVRVTGIAPGMTRNSAAAPVLDDPDGSRAQLEARIPVGRVGEPEDIARAAAFLCSAEAAFVNGADLMADGGDSAMAG